MASEDIRKEILTNELGNIMLDSVAPIYDRSKVALYTFQSFGLTFSEMKAFVTDDMVNQMFPETATWGLKRWEKEFGVVPDVSKTLEHRRAYLMSIMYKKEPMTPYRIRQIANGITGMACEVVENYQPNTLLITIRGYFPQISVLEAEFDKKLPAHLNYVIRMAELETIDTETYSGFAVTEYEKYELEVLN